MIPEELHKIAETEREAQQFTPWRKVLMISGTRPGTQPLNLQGIWNDMMIPPWASQYTININTEMNYWPVETCNLAECAEPLLAMVKDLSETGARTAKTMYGAGGWVLHQNTDIAHNHLDGHHKYCRCYLLRETGRVLSGLHNRLPHLS